MALERERAAYVARASNHRFAFGRGSERAVRGELSQLFQRLEETGAG